MRFATLLLIPLLAAAEPRVPTKKIRLFNGKDLSSFYSFLKNSGRDDPKKVFTVQDGAIRVSGEEWGALTTVDEWRDYRLVVEWRWGGKTWPPRVDRARDSGILLHGVGEDGAAGNGWLESIEYQIIEGGTGDLILVKGKDRPSATAELEPGEKNQLYWKRGAPRLTRDNGRFNWFGRDPAWEDRIGYRGPKDLEKPTGQWNRSEIVARGNSLSYYVNGTLALEAFDVKPSAGKIQFQSEGAEILFRKIELHPARP